MPGDSAYITVAPIWNIFTISFYTYVLPLHTKSFCKSPPCVPREAKRTMKAVRSASFGGNLRGSWAQSLRTETASLNKGPCLVYESLLSKVPVCCQCRACCAVLLLVPGLDKHLSCRAISKTPKNAKASGAPKAWCFKHVNLKPLEEV